MRLALAAVPVLVAASLLLAPYAQGHDRDRTNVAQQVRDDVRNNIRDNIRASARDHSRDDCMHDFSLGEGSLESPARWAPRRESRLARFTILSRDGKVALLLMPTAVAFQLSDGTMRRIDRELRVKADEAEDNPLGEAIKTAVLAGVRVMLKHSAECSLRDLRDIDYRDGELVFITRDGDRVFDHIDMNDENLTRSFDEREAKAFVHEFRRLQVVAGR